MYPITNEWYIRTRTNAVAGSSNWGSGNYSSRLVVHPVTGLLVPGFDDYGRNTSGWVHGVINQREISDRGHIVHVAGLEWANTNWVWAPAGESNLFTNWVRSATSRLWDDEYGSAVFFLRIPLAVAQYSPPAEGETVQSRQYRIWLGPGTNNWVGLTYGTNESWFKIPLLGYTTNVDLRLSRLGYYDVRWITSTNWPYYEYRFYTTDVWYPEIGDLGFWYNPRASTNGQPPFEYRPGFTVTR